jgi:hypothetical protein
VDDWYSEICTDVFLFFTMLNILKTAYQTLPGIYPAMSIFDGLALYRTMTPSPLD